VGPEVVGVVEAVEAIPVEDTVQPTIITRVPTILKTRIETPNKVEIAVKPNQNLLLNRSKNIAD
jgi:hypothetical protein